MVNVLSTTGKRVCRNFNLMFVLAVFYERASEQPHRCVLRLDGCLSPHIGLIMRPNKAEGASCIHPGQQGTFFTYCYRPSSPTSVIIPLFYYAGWFVKDK